MICCSCKIDKLVTEFINNENICYKCVYRKKLDNTLEKRANVKNFCRTCGNQIIIKKNLKKRQRTVFCSKECAELGHKHQLTFHWTRQLNSNWEINCGKSIINRSKKKNSWCNL